MFSEFLYVLAAIGFIIWSIRSAFYWVDFWDRHTSYRSSFRQFLKTFIKLLFSFSTIFSFFIIILILIFLINDIQPIFSELLISLLFIGKGLSVLYKEKAALASTISNSWRRSAVVLVYLFLLSVVFMFPLTERFVWLLLIDRVLFLFIIVAIVVTLFPSDVYLDLRATKVTKKVKKIKHISSCIFIGEKSSEIVSVATSILKKDFNVLSISTTSQSAEVFDTILSRVNLHTEILLVSIRHISDEDLRLLIETLRPWKIFFHQNTFQNGRVVTNLVDELEKRKLSIFLYGKDFKIERLVYSLKSQKNNQTKMEVVCIASKKNSLHCYEVEIDARKLQIQYLSAEESMSTVILPAIYLSDEMGISDSNIKSYIKQHHVAE